jgi:hypothetical protein
MKLVRMESKCQVKDNGVGLHGHSDAHHKLALQGCNATKDIRAMARTTLR